MFRDVSNENILNRIGTDANDKRKKQFKFLGSIVRKDDLDKLTLIG